MAELLIVVDAAEKAEFMKDYYGSRAESVVCGWPLFRTSHQAAPDAPNGVIYNFEGLPAGQDCIDALHTYYDKEIILALDDNYRGNYLCWQIRGYIVQIGGWYDTVKRLSPNAFSKEEVDAAQAVISPVDDRPGLSYYNRLLFDECLAHHLVRLVGTDRGPGNLPLRQNSLTTLFLLREREQERFMFPVVNRWQVQADLTNDAGQGLTANLIAGLELAADGLFRDENKAKALKEQVSGKTFVVEAIQRSPLTISPPEPYQLPELLHDAIVLLGQGLATTMAMLKKFWNGIAMNGRVMGLITSPAPASIGHAPATIDNVRRQVSTLYGKSAVADCDMPGAGMILPLHPELCGQDLTAALSEDEAALYDLIRNRALASQMLAAAGETITVDFRVGKENVFQAHFHDLSETGFMQCAPGKMAHINVPCPVPGLEEGQEFRPMAVRNQLITNEGQAAERYTVETLFAALADFSIAADPTTIKMMDALINLGYVAIVKQGALRTAANASKVVSILDRAFPRMQGINLAAYIEQTISETLSNRKNLPFALKQFDQTLMLHGKILVKAKLPAKIQPRGRTSSTIIKQVVPAPEVTPASSSPPQKQAVDILASPLAEAQAPPQAGLAPDFEPQEAVAQPEAAQRPEAAIEPGPLPEESGPQEKADEPLAADEQGGRGGILGDEDDGDAPWPEDLKKVFAEALAGSTQVDPDDDVPAPPAAPAAEEIATQKAALPVGQERCCPVCGRAMLLKEDDFGPYWGCSGFPGCRYSEAVTPAEEEAVCPLCNRGLTRKQTPTGKSFYVCEDQDCQFMSWSRPHSLPCGLCDSTYLVEKNVRGLTQLRCPRAGCPYGQPLADDIPEPTPAPSAVPTPGTKKILVRRVAPGSKPSGTTKKVRIVRRKK